MGWTPICKTIMNRANPQSTPYPPTLTIIQEIPHLSAITWYMNTPLCFQITNFKPCPLRQRRSRSYQQRSGLYQKQNIYQKHFQTLSNIIKSYQMTNILAFYSLHWICKLHSFFVMIYTALLQGNWIKHFLDLKMH